MLKQNRFLKPFNSCIYFFVFVLEILPRFSGKHFGITSMETAMSLTAAKQKQGGMHLSLNRTNQDHHMVLCLHICCLNL